MAVRAVMEHLDMLEKEGSLTPKIAQALPLFREWMSDAQLNIRALRQIAQVMEEDRELWDLLVDRQPDPDVK